MVFQQVDQLLPLLIGRRKSHKRAILEARQSRSEMLRSGRPCLKNLVFENDSGRFRAGSGNRADPARLLCLAAAQMDLACRRFAARETNNP
jgi:hypothetical protein